MEAMSSSSSQETPGSLSADRKKSHSTPVVRTMLGGILMGMANLVPGISGGTMIVAVGLYDDFVDSIADVTRLRLSRKNVFFLGLIAAGAGVSIASLSGTMSSLVTLHRSAMFALFIGMTLGGVFPLIRMLKRFSGAAILGLAVGLTGMVMIALNNDASAGHEAMRVGLKSGTITLSVNYGRDLAAGVLGMSAMVLPGISGAYMLLILGRYEIIIGAVHVAKNLLLGGEGDATTCLQILIPTAIGSLASLILLSNMLKWLLHAHRELMLGMLVGVLFGSVIGIWPFTTSSSAMDVGVGLFLAAIGFVATAALSRMSA